MIIKMFNYLHVAVSVKNVKVLFHYCVWKQSLLNSDLAVREHCLVWMQYDKKSPIKILDSVQV